MDWHPDLPTWSHLDVDVHDAWNAFILHTLLSYHEERREILVLPHSGHTQEERLIVAMRRENEITAGTGQEHWNHVCDKCCWQYEKNGTLCEYCHLYARWGCHRFTMNQANFGLLSLMASQLDTLVVVNMAAVVHLLQQGTITAHLMCTLAAYAWLCLATRLPRVSSERAPIQIIANLRQNTRCLQKQCSSCGAITNVPIQHPTLQIQATPRIQTSTMTKRLKL